RLTPGQPGHDVQTRQVSREALEEAQRQRHAPTASRRKNVRQWRVAGRRLRKSQNTTLDNISTAYLIAAETNPAMTKTLGRVMLWFVIPLTVITLAIGTIRAMRDPANGAVPTGAES